MKKYENLKKGDVVTVRIGEHFSQYRKREGVPPLGSLCQVIFERYFFNSPLDGSFRASLNGMCDLPFSRKDIVLIVKKNPKIVGGYRVTQ